MGIDGTGGMLSSECFTVAIDLELLIYVTGCIRSGSKARVRERGMEPPMAPLFGRLGPACWWAWRLSLMEPTLAVLSGLLDPTCWLAWPRLSLLGRIVTNLGIALWASIAVWGWLGGQERLGSSEDDEGS